MKTPNKTLKTIALFLAGIILLSSCASTTLIQSVPSSGKLYLNGEYVGETPYTHTDTKIVGSTNIVRIEKEAYETFNGAFSRNEEADAGAIIGGIFFLFPFLWTMKYKPMHTYELTPKSEIIKEKVKDDNIESKAARLRDLKQLLDEGILTEEEYEKEKVKVLEE
jgi:hypothetical protein